MKVILALNRISLETWLQQKSSRFHESLLDSTLRKHSQRDLDIRKLYNDYYEKSKSIAMYMRLYRNKIKAILKTAILLTVAVFPCFLFSGKAHAANVNFSVSAWVRPENAVATKAILVKNEEIRLVTNASSQPLCQIHNGTSWQTAATSSVALTTGTWQHVACTYDGAYLKVYVNAVQTDADAFTTDVNNTANSWITGEDAGATYADFEGKVDEVKIFNYGLTAREIREEFNQASALKLGDGGSVTGSTGGGLEDGLVGWWKMDDNVSGDGQTVIDSSGNGYNGTTSDANSSGMNCTVSGKYGLGCDFDGTDDNITATVTGLSSSYTLSTWFHLDAYETGWEYSDIFNVDGDSVNLRMYNNYESDDMIQLVTLNSNHSYASLNGPTIETNTWYHIVGTWNGNILTLYINGKYYASTAKPSTYTLSTAAMGGSGATRYLDGGMDDSRIYNRALSAKEIEQLYNYGLSPVAYWKLDEGTGTTANDSSGNNYNGETLGGTAWYDTDWSYREKITIDYTKVANTDQAYFPVLINSTDTDWKDTSNSGHVGQSDGGDILFTSSDGVTKLDHEIEGYTASTGELIAWVNVPSLSASSNTELYIYYGNASVTDQWDIEGTWNSDFKMVQHMKDTTTSTITDSTSNNNDGTKSSSGHPTQATGRIGYAQYLDAGAEYIAYADTTTWTWTPVTQERSVSFWYKTTSAPNSNGEYQMLFSANNTAGNKYQAFILNNGGTNVLMFVIRNSSWSSLGYFYTVFSPTSDQWYHMVFNAKTNNNCQIIINGSSQALSYSSWDDSTSINPNEIRASDGLGLNDNFTLDEVHFRHSAKTSDWVTTEYNNQNSPSTFYGIGAETSKSAGAPSWTGLGRFGNALSFDGTDDFVDTTDTPNITGSAPFTMTFWANTKDTGGVAEDSWEHIALQLGSHHDTGQSAMLEVMEDRVSFTSYNLVNSPTYDPSEPINDQWKYISGVYDGSTMSLYIDGKLASSLGGVTLNLTDAVIRIGHFDGGARYYEGLLDDIRIYNYARSQQQILQDMYGDTPGPHPIAKWSLDEGTGQVINSSHGDSLKMTDSDLQGTLGSSAENTTGDPDWITEESSCAKGRCLDFTAANSDYVEVGDLNTNVNTICTWINLDDTTEDILDLDANTHYLRAANGTLSAQGFSSPNIYIDGQVSTVITTGWHHICAKTNTAIDANDVEFGVVNTTYFNGALDEIQFFNYALSDSEIKVLYNQGAASFK